MAAAKQPRGNAAIFYAFDGYDTSRPKLMGRHAAGEGFLRGFARHAEVDRFWGFTTSQDDSKRFKEELQKHKPATPVSILNAGQIGKLAEPGAVFLPGPGLIEHAWNRRNARLQKAYSLCGVTHTTASQGAMDAITGMLVAPVQAWDAIICTSTAVRRTFDRVLEAQRNYLKQRLGAADAVLPQLPVIPLGVDCDFFDLRPVTRKAWRGELGIGEDDVALLFMGRLSFHAKAHPLPMYLAAEAAAKATKTRVHLIQAGWFANLAIEQAFRQGAKQLCPSVNAIFLDGRKPEVRTQIWSAADIFVSMSDNVQETFGLTPIEAMAAGLPAVVSDWDGYKDTVRHGEDGMRITTWQPPKPLGEQFIYRHAMGLDNYDTYCGKCCQFAAIDVPATIEAVTALVADRALRRKMGQNAAAPRPRHLRLARRGRPVPGPMGRARPHPRHGRRGGADRARPAGLAGADGSVRCLRALPDPCAVARSARGTGQRRGRSQVRRHAQAAGERLCRARASRSRGRAHAPRASREIRRDRRRAAAAPRPGRQAQGSDARARLAREARSRQAAAAGRLTRPAAAQRDHSLL